MIISNTIITVLMHHWSQNGVSPTGRSAESTEMLHHEVACPGTLRCSTHRNEVTRVDSSSVPTSENCLHENDKLETNLQQFENYFSPDRKFQENLEFLGFLGIFWDFRGFYFRKIFYFSRIFGIFGDFRDFPRFSWNFRSGEKSFSNCCNFLNNLSFSCKQFSEVGTLLKSTWVTKLRYVEHRKVPGQATSWCSILVVLTGFTVFQQWGLTVFRPVVQQHRDDSIRGI